MAGYRRQKTEDRRQKYSGFCTLKSENGIALVMTLVISAIILAIMTGLIYMITVGTQISGMQKRYKTAQEAGMGGSEVTYQLVALKDQPVAQTSFINNLNNASVTTPAGCTRSGAAECSPTLLKDNCNPCTGLAAKLNLPTSCWTTECDSSLTITPGPNTTYDMRFDLGTSPFPTYRVYAKIVDTVAGNTAEGTVGLTKGGVVSTDPGVVAVIGIPYLYTIEVDAENAANSAERAKYSILYQY